MQFCTKSNFGPNLPQKNVLSKIILRHILGIAIFTSLCKKSQQNIQPIERNAYFSLKTAKGNFPKYENPIFYGQKKISGKNGFSHFLEKLALYLCAEKIEKTNKVILHKSKKLYFQEVFCPNFPPKNYFRKSGSNTWALPFCIIVQKIRKNE